MRCIVSVRVPDCFLPQMSDAPGDEGAEQHAADGGSLQGKISAPHVSLNFLDGLSLDDDVAARIKHILRGAVRDVRRTLRDNVPESHRKDWEVNVAIFNTQHPNSLRKPALASTAGIDHDAALDQLGRQGVLSKMQQRERAELETQGTAGEWRFTRECFRLVATALSADPFMGKLQLFLRGAARLVAGQDATPTEVRAKFTRLAREVYCKFPIPLRHCSTLPCRFILLVPDRSMHFIGWCQRGCHVHLKAVDFLLAVALDDIKQAAVKAALNNIRSSSRRTEFKNYVNWMHCSNLLGTCEVEPLVISNGWLPGEEEEECPSYKDATHLGQGLQMQRERAEATTGCMYCLGKTTKGENTVVDKDASEKTPPPPSRSAISNLQPARVLQGLHATLLVRDPSFEALFFLLCHLDPIKVWSPIQSRHPDICFVCVKYCL